MPVEQSASALHPEKLLTMSDAEIQEEIATLGTEAKGLIVEVVGNEGCNGLCISGERSSRIKKRECSGI